MTVCLIIRAKNFQNMSKVCKIVSKFQNFEGKYHEI